MQLSGLVRRALLAVTVSTTIIAAGLGFCARAHAGQADTIRELLDIVADVTGLTAPVPALSTIHIIPDEHILSKCTDAHGVAGCFDRATGEIYISERFTKMASPWPFRAIMAHELTHYAQWYNGVVGPCQEWRESQAYTVSNKVGAMTMLRVPEFEIKRLARCD